MRFEAPTSTISSLLASLRSQSHNVAFYVDLDCFVWNKLTILHTFGQYVHHGQSALHFGSFPTVGSRSYRAWIKLANGGKQHSGLTQRRQNLPDITKKCRVRTNNQHPACHQLLAKGIEQISGSMQRHCGFPGSGTALHDTNSAEILANDVVLFTLDGGDDVAHLTGALPTECGKKRGF